MCSYFLTILDSAVPERVAQGLVYSVWLIILTNQIVFTNLAGKGVALRECLSNTWED